MHEHQVWPDTWQIGSRNWLISLLLLTYWLLDLRLLLIKIMMIMMLLTQLIWWWLNLNFLCFIVYLKTKSVVFNCWVTLSWYLLFDLFKWIVKTTAVGNHIGTAVVVFFFLLFLQKLVVLDAHWCFHSANCFVWLSRVQ